MNTENQISQIDDLEKQRIAQMNQAKLASLGEMAASIAHEINNPLAIINGKTSQILRRMESSECDIEKCIQDLHKIENTIQRIAKIVKGLRTFARTTENDPLSLTVLAPLIDDTIELCRERFKNSGVQLTVKPIANLYLNCRPAQISQVLLNLLNNSYDAISANESKWVEVNAEDQGEQICLSVTDSGPGISSEIVNKMMEPFYTTKEVGKGTGLGLSISKGIVEDHGGQFYYDQNSEHTRFVIMLPKAMTQKKTA